jgi:hypothetical protein
VSGRWALALRRFKEEAVLAHVRKRYPRWYPETGTPGIQVSRIESGGYPVSRLRSCDVTHSRRKARRSRRPVGGLPCLEPNCR